MKALLLSGGIDSGSLAFMLRPEWAITINYGQKAAKAELNASMVIASTLGIKHEIIAVDCTPVGAGTMVEAETRSQKDAITKMAPTPEWWPYRNQLLITLAAARSLHLGVKELVVGTVFSDGQHLDGTPEFISRMTKLLEGQEGELRLIALAVQMTSEELVRNSGIPLSLLAWTHSCHIGNLACGECRGCLKRQFVLQNAEEL